MKDTKATLQVAELRQHLSRALRRVKRGESILVMSRNEPVAELRPCEEGGTGSYQALLEAGQIRAPRIGPPRKKGQSLKRKIDVTALLDDVRGEK